LAAGRNWHHGGMASPARAALALLAALAAAPAAAEQPPRTIRVLTHNIYGRHEADCETRYKALARHILSANPPYDIVALQEHWRVPHDHWISCDDSVLTKALEADGRYKGKDRSVKHKPATDDVLQAAGGNSVFTLHSIVDEWDGHWVNGKDLPLSGYLLTRVEVAPGAVIDLWNAHLEAGADGCDDDCRWEQATDFGAIVELFSGGHEKGKAPNPVLIVGDFNTGGPMTKTEKPPFAGNGGYDTMMDAMRYPRDLWLELGSAPGFTYDCTLNPIGKCGYRERIDYVLLPEDKHILSPETAYYLVPKSVGVVRWLTDDGKPVSDHFGLDATFELRPRPRLKAALTEAAARIGQAAAQAAQLGSAR
jgi:endonuclease/exonuclease/phosphatase family metal-dependent hydrolase